MILMKWSDVKCYRTSHNIGKVVAGSTPKWNDYRVYYRDELQMHCVEVDDKQQVAKCLQIPIEYIWDNNNKGSVVTYTLLGDIYIEYGVR